MCSSPKASRSFKKNTSKAVFVSMSSDARARFTEVANRAQERKEQRELLSRTNPDYKIPKVEHIKKVKKSNNGFMNTLRNLGFAI